MKRWHIVVLATLLLLGIGIVTGYRLGVRLLQDRLADLLGPRSSIASLKVNWFSLDLFGVTIEAPQDWPTARAFRAERITIVPSLGTLLTDQIHISSIVFEEPYLAVLRTREKMVMVPRLTETAAGKKKVEDRSSDVSRRTVTISKITMQQGVVELFDATVSRPPLKTRLERVDGVIRDIKVPWLETKTHFELAGVVKGMRRDGSAKAAGWVGLAGKDSSSQITLDAVDLVSLQPYLVRLGEAKLRKGILDMRLDSEVRANRLDGKGKIIITDLEFAPSRSYFETFMGMPRSAVISFLKNHQNAIDVDFILTGDVSNPRFSINEAIATRLAMGMAAELGVSIRSLAEDFGTLGRRSVEGVAGVVEGAGAVLKGLLGGAQK
jgi:uncharacterized protein involved in outer membrane biogenesis